MRTKISDDFNRADNNTVGTATVGGAWSERGVAAGAESILSSEVQLGNSGNESAIYIAHGSLFQPVSLSCKVTKHGATRTARIGFKADTNILGNHIGLNFGTDNISLTGNNNGTSTNTAQSLAGTFYLWLDSVTNGSNVDLSLYFSATTTKPGSALLTLTNCVDSTGANAGVFHDSNTGGQYISIDDFLLSDDSAIVADTAAFVITGNATGVNSIFGFVATVATYTVTGIAVTIRRWWSNINKSAASWLNPDKNSSAKTNLDKSSASWLNEDKS